jgi:hypothetical protein
VPYADLSGDAPPLDRQEQLNSLWRRQIALALLAGGGIVPAAFVAMLASSEWSRDPANRLLVSLIGAALIVLLCALLGILLVHLAHVARFTLRRGA